MLPIALKSFHIKNYRGIINTQIDNIPPDTQWIFLTGENGFGKTSVLQALAVMLSGKIITEIKKPTINTSYYEHGKVIDQEFLHFGGFFDFNLSVNEDDWNKASKIQESSNNQEIKEPISSDLSNFHSFKPITYSGKSNFPMVKIVAYGSTRLRVSKSSSKQVLSESSNVDSLFSSDILLADIEEKFKDWYKNYPKGFKEIEKIFRTLLPRLGKISAPFNDETKESKVEYFETDTEGNLLDEGTDFNNLAAGYRNIIATVGDMIFRLGTIQHFDYYKDLEGIVIIDEFELHLHPAYQKLFVQKLTELFPKIQFVVSTHSPIPLLGVGKDTKAAIINVSRTREHGIKAELLKIDFSVLTPNAILSSPIFGFQDLIPDSKSDDKMIRTEDTFQEVEFNDQLKKNINEFLTEDRQKELLNLLKIKAL
ncbi:MAG: hypothetical protein RLZZ306_1208 [Bacteroidota bacterium]